MTSDDLSEQLAKAELHFNAGRVQQARRSYERIADRHPDSSEAHFQLALLLLDSGDSAGAVRHFREVLRLRPDVAEVHFNVGTLLHGIQNLDDAIKSFEQAITLQPDMADAHNNLGIIHREQGDYERAIGCFREALHHAPAHGAAALNLAAAMISCRQTDGLPQLCDRVCELNPDLAQARFLKGLALELAGQNEEAIHCFEEGARLDPSSASAYFVAASRQASVPAMAPADYITSLFDQYAARFDDHLTKELRYQTPQLIHRAVMKLAPGSSLRTLDLGCGTGLAGILFRDISAFLAGVDLSSAMIQEANKRQLYDQTRVQDIVGYLKSDSALFDLILAADVFVYIGDLKETFQGVRTRLRAGGLFAFSVEAAEEETDTEENAPDFQLCRTRRYRHSLQYLRRLAAEVGLDECIAENVVIRTEGRRDVHGWIMVLRNPPLTEDAAS